MGRVDIDVRSRARDIRRNFFPSPRDDIPRVRDPLAIVLMAVSRVWGMQCMEVGLLLNTTMITTDTRIPVNWLDF